MINKINKEKTMKKINKTIVPRNPVALALLKRRPSSGVHEQSRSAERMQAKQLIRSVLKLEAAAKNK